jgi:hypothetical protein
MDCSMEVFYSRLTSSRTDENPLFAALRSITRLDPRTLITGEDESNAWSPWDPTGTPPDFTPEMA